MQDLGLAVEAHVYYDLSSGLPKPFYCNYLRKSGNLRLSFSGCIYLMA